MSTILIGICKYNRTIEGEYKTGKRQGDHWEFLSLEIVDTTTGYVWSCQVPSEDSSYQNVPDNELKGHKVRARITSQTAAPRDLPDGSKRMQIRSQLTAFEDLGLPQDE